MVFQNYVGHAAPFILICSLALPGSVHAAQIFSSAGYAPADIQKKVDDFRDELGDLNPFTPENFDDGRRQINWDAAPDAISDPAAFPGDFFNGPAAPRARGIEFKGNDDYAGGGRGAKGFQLSSTAASGEPVEFGFEKNLQTFSPERLFAPTGGTVFDVLFFDPADQTTPALTDGFGAVFTNVIDNDYVYMSFFDAFDNLLAQEYVEESGAGGLSFLGASFKDNVLAKVTIVAGLFAVDDHYANGSNVVAMDDFIFGEPINPAPVPIPASLFLLLSAFAPLAYRHRAKLKAA
ncbi:hypothetical protein ROLI_044370 [Roseobacter fucihabitans]|uniref:Uncharacterized protein n=1 Tax=Roseobacter fucihabitans TaxID=1537242 RepID=A0ABZ2C004_9RHOB|nr:hypothetical protein [Roseobacter litoralis]MBC6963916.1 hypothetical protein [Roseobacter litoralis]MBC6963999.1 hypothetical protein [Roseobacter litoralis]